MVYLSKIQRPLHPQARLFPEGIWKCMFGAGLHDSIITLMTLSNPNDLFIHLQTNAAVYLKIEQHVFVACMVAYPELTLEPLNEIRDILNLGLKDSFNHYAALGRLDLVRQLIEKNSSLPVSLLSAAIVNASIHGHLNVVQYLVAINKNAMFGDEIFEVMPTLIDENQLTIMDFYLHTFKELDFPNLKDIIAMLVTCAESQNRVEMKRRLQQHLSILTIAVPESPTTTSLCELMHLFYHPVATPTDPSAAPKPTSVTFRL